MEEDCGICLCALCDPTKATATLPCRHIYHDECVRLWSETSNSCPYCRAEFTLIVVRHGDVVREVAIAPVVRVDDDEIDELGEEIATTLPIPAQRPGERCIVCGGSHRQDELMLCDHCNDAYHHACLADSEAVSTLIGPFFCPTCELTGQAPSPEDCVPTRVRTVETNAHLTRGQSHLPPHRVDRSRQWTRAWQRVRSRAWNRLNADLEYTYDVVSPLPTVSQSWRNRIERGRRPVEEVVVRQDPETERLWRAFERASVQLATRPGSSSNKRSSSKRRSSSVSSSDDVPVASGSRQKRPVKRRQVVAHVSTAGQSQISITGEKATEAPSQRGDDTTSTRRNDTTPARRNDPTPTRRNDTTPTQRNDSLQRQLQQDLRSQPATDQAAVIATRPAKSTIAAAVSARLKPFYKTKIDRETFTSLNRRITHTIHDGWSTDTNLEARVADEVQKAMGL